MIQWPHSPVHLLEKSGAFIVSSATYQKEPFFRGPANLDYLADSLLQLAGKYHWRLQAWAVFPNHYHFVALTPENPDTLRDFIRHLHSVTAIEINKRQSVPGRRVWFEYWDTRLTDEKSYVARLSYVHRNAVRHGLVREPSLYPWCSAGWFEQKAKRSFFRRVMDMKIDRVSVPDDFQLKPEDCEPDANSSGVRELAPALNGEARFAAVTASETNQNKRAAKPATQPQAPGNSSVLIPGPQQAAAFNSGSKLPHSRAGAEAAMEEVLGGRWSTDEITSFLQALRERELTVDELAGFATAMRRHAEKVFPDGPPPGWTLVDTCGTGGDATGTFNISTCAAFVVAGAGVRVAKHGNRSISSKCGSADVLEALGVKVDSDAAQVRACIEKIGIGFLFAPVMHSAVRHAMPARRALGGRTVFNLLGPLTNPAGAQAQVLGVYDAAVTELVAQTLAELGCKRAFVVHGADGLDEISLSGETRVSEVRDGAVRTYTVTPEDFGLPRAPLSAMAGGDAQQNAQIIRDVLAGKAGPHRDIVLANAAASLVAAGAAAGFRQGVARAASAITSGAAAAKLAEMARP